MKSLRIFGIHRQGKKKKEKESELAKYQKFHHRKAATQNRGHGKES